MIVVSNHSDETNAVGIWTTVRRYVKVSLNVFFNANCLDVYADVL